MVSKAFLQLLRQSSLQRSCCSWVYIGDHPGREPLSGCIISQNLFDSRLLGAATSSELELHALAVRGVGRIWQVYAGSTKLLIGMRPMNRLRSNSNEGASANCLGSSGWKPILSVSVQRGAGRVPRGCCICDASPAPCRSASRAVFQRGTRRDKDGKYGKIPAVQACRSNVHAAVHR